MTQHVYHRTSRYRVSIPLYKIITRPQQLDLAQSHAEYRVLFVGQKWFDDVNRPISRGYRMPVKYHGKWTFVLAFTDPMTIAEIPLLSRWSARRAIARSRSPVGIPAPNESSPDALPSSVLRGIRRPGKSRAQRLSHLKSEEQ